MHGLVGLIRSRLGLCLFLAAGTLLCEPPADAQSSQDNWAIEWTDADCRSCHEVSQPLFNHPVGVRPSMAIPNSMPLERGRLGCTTCHKADVDSHARSRQNHDGMLRAGGTPGTAFCTNCHGDDTFGHTLAIGRAHLQWDDRTNPGDAAYDPFGAALGTRSQRLATTHECLGCHDGGMANDIGKSHPINIEYRNDFAADRTRRLIDPANLDVRIRLFDGKIGCGSCHSPYADNEKLLVMGNDRGQLCKSCHDLR